MAWRLLAWAAGTACRFGDAAEASRHAMRARERGRATCVRSGARRTAYAAAAALGPTLVDEAIDRCEAAIEQTAGDRQSEGILLAVLAGLYAMQGAVRPCALEAAREPDRSSRSSGSKWRRLASRGDVGAIERLAGDLEAAERELRSSYDVLDAVGETFLLSTVAGFLAQTLLEQRSVGGGERVLRAEP